MAGQGARHGEQQLGAPSAPSWHKGSAAIAYVRPHELEILPADALVASAPPSPSCAHGAADPGGCVGMDGETRAAHYEAELSKEAAHCLGSRPGVRLVAGRRSSIPTTRFEGEAPKTDSFRGLQPDPDLATQ